MSDAEIIQPNVIDLNQPMTEQTMRAMGSAIELALKQMFGAGSSIPVNVRGTQEQVNAFMKALRGERDLISRMRSFGLGDSRTMASRTALQRSIKAFERETGIPWPIRN